MLTNIRKPEVRDLNYILDIDLKCFDDNWGCSEWRDMLVEARYGVLIGTYNGIPVGFIVWFSGVKGGLIIRMGVKPSYRHNGVGSQLLSAVETILIQNGNKDVQFPIVESFCYPSCTFDLSQWLTHRKYAATRVMKGTGIYMGEKEDEIVFTKSLRV